MAVRDGADPLFAIRTLPWKEDEEDFLAIQPSREELSRDSFRLHGLPLGVGCLGRGAKQHVASERSDVLAVFHTGLLPSSLSSPVNSSLAPAPPSNSATSLLLISRIHTRSPEPPGVVRDGLS